MSDQTRPIWLFVSGGTFLLAILFFFVSSFIRPEILSFEPTEPAVRSGSESFVVDTVTLDSRSGEGWIYFDFESGLTLNGRIDPAWDIAIQRFHIVANGGAGYPGDGGALAVLTDWDSTIEAPAAGYETTRGRLDSGPVNPALERWYEYSFLAHTLKPKPEIYVVRTSDGRYAKMAVLSYYCTDAVPGCFTFRYGFRTDGDTRLAP